MIACLLTAALLTATPPPPIDWERVKANTARFQAAQAGRSAEQAAFLATGLGHKLAKAQSALSAGDRASARAGIDAAQMDLLRGRAGADRQLDAFRDKVKGLPHEAEILQRLDAQQAELQRRTAEIQGLMNDAWAGATLDDSLGDRLVAGALTVRGANARQRMEQVQARLREWGAMRELPILGAQLTYVQGGLKAGAPSKAQAVPAYLAGSAAPGPGLDDTTQGREVELSPDIVTKAQSLGSAQAAYDYVRGLRLDWYSGSLKGSTETLREGRGNDADLSTLLVALLRAQGTPARYVQGSIQLPLPKVADLMGLLTQSQLDALYATGSQATPFALAPGLRDKVLQGLSSAGVPYVPVQSSGDVTAVTLSHFWVEAYLPYANYRGGGAANEGKQWIPLDVAIPGTAKYAATPPVVDGLDGLGLSANVLTSAYLAAPTTSSLLAFVRGQVQTALAAQKPQVTYPQVLRQVVHQTEALPLIPGTLPYAVTSVQADFAFLPDAVKHQLHLTVSDAAGVLLDATLPLHQLTGHRAVLAYQPASVADVEAIVAAGGIYQVPPAAVQLIPVIRVDGQVRASGIRSVGLGTLQSWTFQLLLPDGSNRRIDNTVVAGNVVALGLGGPFNRFVEPAPSPPDTDGPAPQYLYARTTDYANAWTSSEEELAQLAQVVLVRPTANVSFVENQLAVVAPLGVVQQVSWKGLEVDADLRTMVPLELVAGHGAQLQRLSGFEGSFQEAQVLAAATQEESVCAVTVIQQANATGIPILDITQQNQASVLPLLQAAPNVVADVQGQLTQGREVLIPETPLTLQNWTGTGYIAIAPTTQEGGYFLSGIVSGGQTVVSPQFWTDQSLVQTLSNATAPAATRDTSQIARIIKVPTTDGQVGPVGQPLPTPIRVFVTTLSGTPVQDAGVTFQAAVGSHNQPQFVGSSGPVPTLSTTTDAFGSASAQVILDTSITKEAIEVNQPDASYPQLYGFDQVTAQTANGAIPIGLANPFLLLAQPGPASQVVTDPTLSGPSAEPGVDVGLSFPAVVEDAYGNPLANQSVSWTQNPIAGAFINLALAPAADAVVLNPLDPSQSPALIQTSDEQGNTAVGYIPGNGVTQELLSAQVGSASGNYTVVVRSPSEYLFELARASRAMTPGIYGTSLPGPVATQIFHRDPLTEELIPLTGTESNVAEISATLTVSDPAGNLLDSETTSPDSPGPAATAPFRDGTNEVFWPGYLVQDGFETLRASAHLVVTSVDAQGHPIRTNIAFGSPLTLQTLSSTVPTGPLQVLQGQASTPAPNGVTSVDDVGAGFSIGNNAAYPIFARVTQLPKVAGDILETTPITSFSTSPTDPTLFQLPASGTALLLFNVNQSSGGGDLRLDVFAPDPAGPVPLKEVATNVLHLTPHGTGLVAQGQLAPGLTLLVRNFESTATPPQPGQGPITSTEPPIVRLATFPFTVTASGRVTVQYGNGLTSNTLAVGDVTADATGALTVTPVSGSSPPLLDPVSRGLVVSVPPLDLTGDQVTVRLVRTDGRPTETQNVPATTTVDDLSALPVGATFVKDVSVVDGHVFKQYEDVRVPGRGPPLALVRSYSSTGSTATPLGSGWTHSYEGYLIEDPNNQGFTRYIVVGGEGTGQAFHCQVSQTQCTVQRGYHGTMFGKDVPNATGGVDRHIVYRAKNGTTYEFGPAVSQILPQGVQLRHHLVAITDPPGNAITLEYGPASQDNEVGRVYGPGRARYLQFVYTRNGGAAPRAELAQVELMLNPAAPAALAPGQSGVPLDVCVAYSYDANGNLSSAARYGTAGCQGTALRTESYAYEASPFPALQNNLAAYTDPNGNTTTYAYYAKTDSLPGETGFVLFGDKQERVKQVVEPATPSTGLATTQFTYSLTVNTLPIFGQPITAYETDVLGPRPGVPATQYRLNPYGAAVDTLRPLNPSVTAESQAIWDPTHERILQEQDPRGRQTFYKYDALGNLTERRVLTPVLAASGDGPATEGLTDGSGQPVSAVVERWAYDPAFSQPVCHIDPEGRATLFTLDSNGADPRAATPSGTGLVLTTTRRGTLVPASQLTATTDCLTLAQGISPTATDIVTIRRYCGVQSVACPAGAAVGDLVESLDGNGNSTKTNGFDSFGDATSSIAVGSTGVPLPVAIATASTFDNRSRLTEQTDTFGHDLVKNYDGLDRPTLVQRNNKKGASPGQAQSFTYYAGGQVQTETNGLGMVRTTSLDALNRPIQVTEAGGGLPQGGYSTATAYDEAGNKTRVTDRRGVSSATLYDYGDRPTQVAVSIGQPSIYSAQRGEPGVVGQAGVIATFGYDAAGNKVFETDIHGHLTKYGLDSLYRVVRVTSPQVPGASLSAPGLTYDTFRRFDRAGNKTYELDGNGHATSTGYDAFNRVASVTDAIGRNDARGYDFNGNLTSQVQSFNGLQHLARTSTFDALNRPLNVSETLSQRAGLPALTYNQAFQYADPAHTAYARDRRGFVATRTLDDVDRLLSQTMDDGAAPLARTPDDPRAGAALALGMSYGYDADGNRTSSTDALGRKTGESFDGLNRKVSRALPMGVTESFGYDGDGRVISHVDWRGIERDATFDAAGRPAKDILVESFSNNGQPLITLSRAYADTPDANGLVSSLEVDALAHPTTRYTDGLHREVRVVDAVGNESDTAYDALLKRQTRDRKGYLATLTYDAVNRLVSQVDSDTTGDITNGLSYSQTSTYDDGLLTETAADRRGISTVREKDGLGRVQRTTRGAAPDVQVDTSTYDGDGNVTLAVDANGHTTESVYDGANRRLQQTRGLGTADASTTTFTYDAVGNRLSSKSARVTGVPYDVRDSYDDLDRSVRTEDAVGNVTSRAFDGAGNKLCELRPLGGSPLASGGASGLTVAQVQAAVCQGSPLWQWAYEEDSRVSSEADANGGVESFVYDEARNLLAKQDANSNLTTFQYDVLNRRTAEHQHLEAQSRLTEANRDSVPQAQPNPNPVTGVGTLDWARGYDANGNLTLETDPKLQTKTSVYGLLDRLASVTYANVQTTQLPQLASVADVYDGNGNLTQATETKRTASGTVAEVYGRVFDSLDRLKNETRYDGKVVNSRYDAKGNKTHVDEGGLATDYSFDALDRLKTAVTAEGTTTYGYWPDSLLQSVALPNGLSEGRCYDAASRLLTLISARGTVSTACAPSGVLVSQYAYAYDADGNRSQLVETRTTPGAASPGPAQTTTYGYDALDRLVGAAYPDGTTRLYSLDAVGNRVGEKAAPSSAVPLPLTPASFGSVPNAALTKNTTGTFNRVDWLLSLSDSVDATQNAALAYDLDGNLTQKQTSASNLTFAWDARNTLTVVFGNGVQAGRYDYDRNLQRVKRATTSENVEYVLDDKYVLVEADGSQASHPVTRRYHYSTQPLEVVSALNTASPTALFLSNDTLGSVSDFTDTTGAVSQVHQYDAWGNFRGGTAPSFTRPKLAYTGHQFDVETGLIYARARYYDSQLGRFLSRDTVEGTTNDAPSLHRYLYVRGNPLQYTDFLGNAGCGSESSSPQCPVVLKELGESVGETAEEVASKGGSEIGSTPRVPSPKGDIFVDATGKLVSVGRAVSTGAKVFGASVSAAVGTAVGYLTGSTQRKQAQQEQQQKALEESVNRTIATVGSQECANGNTGACDAVKDLKAEHPELFSGTGVSVEGDKGSVQKVELPSAERNSVPAVEPNKPHAVVGEPASPTASVQEPEGNATGIEEPEAHPPAMEAAPNPDWGKLRSVGGGRWESTSGLIYGQGSAHGNRVRHVLEHGAPDPTKPVHSVFIGGKPAVLPTIDEAWSQHGAPEPNDPGAYIVPLGRPVGTQGEDAVRIIVRPGTSEIITAFPVHSGATP